MLMGLVRTEAGEAIVALAFAGLPIIVLFQELEAMRVGLTIARNDLRLLHC